jgi:hypothetical protein
MQIPVISRVKFDSIQKTTLVNSKGKSYRVAFNEAIKLETGSFQFSLWSKKNDLTIVQHWYYNPVVKRLSRRVNLCKDRVWTSISGWKTQNIFLKEHVW